MRTLLRGMWFGLVITGVALVLPAVYVAYYGPLYDRWGWVELSFGLPVLVVMGLAGLVALLRSPNPYSRTYALYHLQDTAKVGELDSGGAGWLWNVLPPVAAASALLLVIIW